MVRCIILLICFIFSLSDCEAGPRHNITVADLGGKNQLGFTALGGDLSYPWINVLKSGNIWKNADAQRGGPAPNTLDSNGYPTSIDPTHGGITSVFYVPSTAQLPGGVTYNVKITGSGTFSLSSATGSSCAFPCAATNQTITGITFSSMTPTLTISVAGITDIAIYRSDYSTNYTNGEIFAPDFKAKLTDGNFGVLRFGNWQWMNTGNVTKWADRTPTTYFSYQAQQLKSAYYVGTSGGTSTAYTGTLGSGAPTDRQTIHVLWHIDATTTTPTFNLNGSGAIPMVQWNTQALDASSQPQINRIATLIYDASLNQWLTFGGGSGTFNVGISGGAPVEYMVQLCNEILMNPWFTSPYLTTAPISGGTFPDYMPQLIAYTQANLNSILVPRFEGINELWNTAQDFYGTLYAGAKAASYAWSSSSFHQYQGMAISLIGQAASTVYGGNRSKYMVINGVQQGNGVPGTTTNSDPRMTAASWIAKGAPTVGAGYTISAASGWVTHIAPSSYIGSAMTISDEFINAFAYVVTNAGNPTAQAVNADAFIAGAYIGSPTCVAPYSTGRCASGLNSKSYNYVNWKAWAAGFGVTGMTPYEGGWSPDYFTVGSTGDSTATGGTQSNGNATMTAVSAPAATTTITLDAGSAVPAVGMAVRPIGTGTALSVATATVSISVASPSLVTWAANTLLANQPVIFQNCSANPPTGLTFDTVYYVKTPGSSFTVSATPGGAAINTTGIAGSCTGIAGWTVTNVAGQVVTLNVDSTAFGTSSAGTAQFMGAALLRNTLRWASTNRPSLTQLELDNAQALVTAGGIVPSNYWFTNDNLPASGFVWSTLYDMYTTTSPRWDAIKSWNSTRSRQ